MNRHTRITDRVKEKNARLYFKEYTTPKTKQLIKEYEKLVRLSFEKQLGKLNEAMQWDFVQKCFNFSIALKKNKQTENISLNMVTYNRTLENPHCTPLKHFLEDKHIPLF